MGNCLKSNKVEPNNSAEMLERGTPDRRSAKSKHADMIQDLMEEGILSKPSVISLDFIIKFKFHVNYYGKKAINQVY